MSDTTNTEQQPNDEANTGDTQGQEPTTTTETPQPQAQGDDIPDWVREKLTKANNEAAKYRTQLREHEAKVSELSKQQADLEAFKQQIGKQLGLVEDNDDPQALLDAAVEREKTAQEERDKLANELRDYRRRDTIRDQADGADVELLTALLQADARFLELEMDSDDYATQVGELVKEKINKHPSLKTQVVASASGVDTSNTSSGADRKLTREDLKTMTASEINAAVKAGKLNHLMGK
ncbi:hypothetical protein ACEN2A_01865 [Corynebacterium auriscanis]|uniref:hypothetical protein n=1 Tax=Corynebacterium auriscanis TaxID=99807 RepID=UPI003CF1BB3E